MKDVYLMKINVILFNFIENYHCPGILKINANTKIGLKWRVKKKKTVLIRLKQSAPIKCLKYLWIIRKCIIFQLKIRKFNQFEALKICKK